MSVWPLTVNYCTSNWFTVNGKLLYIELVSLGTLSQSIVEPMDIFAWALHKQVSMLVLVHNHPSGDLMPTTADLELTDQMIQVGVRFGPALFPGSRLDKLSIRLSICPIPISEGIEKGERLNKFL